MYKFFGDMSGMAISSDTSEGILGFVGFNKFATSFNIWPGLMTNDEFVKLFKSMVRKKT